MCSAIVAERCVLLAWLFAFLLRRACNNDPAQLMWALARTVVVQLIACSRHCRALATTAELKLGVLTALIGAPMFLYLIFKVRRLEQ